MAGHHLSLAKATFAASLFRPDVTKVTRDDLAQFHSALEVACAQCSHGNIQTCKQWLCEHVISSPTRTAALGKFLVSFSKHLGPEPSRDTLSSISRRRLHLLYLLNDIFHHATYHTSGSPLQSPISIILQPFVLELFQLCAAEPKKRVSRRLHDLADIWQANTYYTETFAQQLHEAIAGEQVAIPKPDLEVPIVKKNASDLPYMMPATHGDPALAFHDLPAANLMPLIVPNSAQPIRPEDVRALQFSAGPADESLVNALKDFLADIDGEEGEMIKTDGDDMLDEMDEMGQVLERDEVGNPRKDTYYGWSLAFCEKMKGRGKEKLNGSSRQSRSRSSSQDRGRNYQKRRRYSHSSSGRSRSSRSSRSPSRDRLSPRRRTFRSRDRREDRSRSRSYSPGRPPAFSQKSNVVVANNPPAPSLAFPPPPPLPPGVAFPPPPPLLNPSGFPIPPPPPPNWNGEWPPAPPGLHFPTAPPPPPSIHPSHISTRPPYQPRYDGSGGGYGR